MKKELQQTRHEADLPSVWSCLALSDKLPFFFQERLGRHRRKLSSGQASWKSQAADAQRRLDRMLLQGSNYI